MKKVETTDEKRIKWDVVSYWALAYNCLELDKLLAWLSFIAVICLTAFIRPIGTVEQLFLLLSTISFALALLCLIVIFKLNNDLLIQAIQNQNNGTSMYELLDKIALGLFGFGVITFVILAIVQL